MTTDSILYLSLSALLIGTTAAWSVALVQYPFTARLSRAEAARFSSGFWFAWGVLPLLGGLALAGFSVVSGYFSAAGWMHDHCAQHPGHPHLCLLHISEHPPEGSLFWASVLLLTALPLSAATRVVCPARELSRHIRRRALEPGSRYPFRTIPGELPAAFTAGLFSPRTYLTQGAANLLTSQEQAIVLHHEEEHVRKRDPLRLFVLSFCSHWLPGMEPVCHRWRLMSEIECDQAVLRAGFSADQVALTILKLSRATSTHLSKRAALAYAEADGINLRRRIECLLGGGSERMGDLPVLAAGGTLALLLAVYSFEIHHALETFLGWLN